ncbi:MAG: NAD(P)/FAD-dependent oxidoreductase [Woeseiaceae bacterium]|nr:NAD(P)/FAD-dependent oxidoreductase [Woeseiaceae bacterium]
MSVATETFDIVIVGAGLSGVGAACHIERRCAGRSYVVLEGRERMGGTWDLFRYPGIRSDSDMHTLGYSFRPWREAQAIADGPAILGYIRDTAAEFGIGQNIRYRHAVTGASWSDREARWTVEVEKGPDREPARLKARFLLVCAGYYSYERGHLPEFTGRERFSGTIIHPQQWPEDLDCSDRKIVVIGSGATAMTLVPQLARRARHVVMLQRSPTWVIAWPDRDAIANALRRVLPDRAAYALTRWKNIRMQRWLYRQTRRRPERVKRKLLQWVRDELGPEFDVERHFTPTYDPWDQRLCLLPNGDLFEVLRDGSASIVTDRIESFTETGIALASGTVLEADIIVTATGLELVVLGGMALTVDGAPVDPADAFTYKGVMLSGVPNLVSTFGYVNASWTLRSDLVAEYFCRLVNYAGEHGYDWARPELRAEDRAMPQRPWVSGFSPGYIQRVVARLPKQGDREPWLNPQDYIADRKRFRAADIADGVLVFGRAAQQPGQVA